MSGRSGASGAHSFERPGHAPLLISIDYRSQLDRPSRAGGRAGAGHSLAFQGGPAPLTAGHYEAGRPADGLLPLARAADATTMSRRVDRHLALFIWLALGQIGDIILQEEAATPNGPEDRMIAPNGSSAWLSAASRAAPRRAAPIQWLSLDDNYAPGHLEGETQIGPPVWSKFAAR